VAAHKTDRTSFRCHAALIVPLLLDYATGTAMGARHQPTAASFCAAISTPMVPGRGYRKARDG
ncbi:MAG TPA: hypothetical protein VIF57_26360, partial [Polyangia bacterium]